MIKEQELRLGNLILQKQANRIVPARVNFEHLDLLAKGAGASFFPIVLKQDWLEKCGFVENKKYALLPEAHEFVLTLAVNGNSQNEIRVWIKNNGECFGRAMVNDAAASNNFYHLHQLQNLFFALTGSELEIK